MSQQPPATQPLPGPGDANDLDADEVRAQCTRGRALYLPRARLRGLDLRGLCSAPGALLAAADLSGSDLRGAALPRSDARRALLAGADLRGACLRGSDLRGVRLASVAGRSLAGADLSDARLPASLQCSISDGTAEGPAEEVEEEQRGWEGLDVSGADLSGHKFAQGVDWRSVACMRGARLARCALRGALFGGDLCGCVFDDSDLTGAVFAGASLDGASFIGCVLIDTEFEGCAMQGVCLRGCRMARTRLSRATSFAPADMSGARLEAVAGLARVLEAMPRGTAGVTVAGSDVEDRAWEGQLSSWTFADCRLSRCDFTRCRLDGVAFTGATALVSCDLGGARRLGEGSAASRASEPRQLGDELVEMGAGVVLHGTRLAGADMGRWAGWRGVTVESCDLRCSCLPPVLDGCKVSGSDMRLGRAPAGLRVEGRTVFCDCNMRGMAFEAAVLKSVSFERVCLRDTVWLGSTLRNVAFGSGTDLTRARFDDQCALTCAMERTVMQDAAACTGTECRVVSWAEERTKSPPSLVQAPLPGKNENRPPTGGPLGVLMIKCKLNEVDLRHAKLGHARMVEQLDLSGRNFRGCNLRGSDLSGSVLRGAKLGSADLTDADLRDAIGLDEAEITNKTVLEGAQIWSSVGLRGRDLCGVNLQNAVLRGADLSGTNLRGANLEGADLSMVVLCAATVDRTTRMSRARLSRADLSGMDLRAVGLSKAHLSDAIVCCVDLRSQGHLPFPTRCD
eukprot:m51a1_g6012 hypothetical protein (738) ;mRNA; r:65748-68497